MWRVGLDQIDDEADRFDAEVLATPGIDHFCSSSAWVLSAHATLMGTREAWAWRGEHGWLVVARTRRAGTVYLEPLELAWGLACPLIGRDPEALAGEVVAELCRRPGWDCLLVAGVPADGRIERGLLDAAPPGWRWGCGRVTRRHVASLEGGFDGFLSRRSRNLRKALRASERDAAAAGLRFEPVEAGPDQIGPALERVAAIEARSWKGQAGVGVDQGPMLRFYQRMGVRLARAGRVRLMVARDRDRDVGFVLGGVLGDTYRGLQFSFDDEYRRFSLGNLMQRHQVEALCREGIARYDLGTAMAYKERWGELIVDTELLVVARR